MEPLNGLLVTVRSLSLRKDIETLPVISYYGEWSNGENNRVHGMIGWMDDCNGAVQWAIGDMIYQHKSIIIVELANTLSQQM